MEKLPHYYFSWIAAFQKQRYMCKMLPLETKQSRGKPLPILDFRGSVSRVNIQHQALQQKRLQGKEDGTAQLQDLNVEFKNLESKMQIRKFENGNAVE